MQKELTKLVCMGDSLTEAYGIEASNGWTSIIERQLKIPVINSGISGETTAGMLGRFQNTAIDHNPSHIIIMGGTNDIDFDLPINLVLSNIKSMTRQARDVGIQYLMCVPPPFFPIGADIMLTYKMQESQLERKLEDYSKVLREMIEYDGEPFVDFSVGMNREYFLSDGIHPNESGHEYMAEQILAMLEGML